MFYDKNNFQIECILMFFPVKTMNLYNVISKTAISISIDSSWPLKLFAESAGDHSTLGGWAIPQCTAAESGGDGESGGEGETRGKSCVLFRRGCF